MDGYTYVNIYLPKDPVLQLMMGALFVLTVIAVVRGILDILPG